jgi:mitochondrial fission protein ELM1
VPCEIHEIAIHSRWQGFFNWILKRFPLIQPLPKPHLILAAGHATHLHLLAAQRTYGGKTVVVMKPSLPLNWFDYCLIPEHDHPAPAANVINTRGGLTNVLPTSFHNANEGLILIGGPSPHFHWNNQEIASQVDTLANLRNDLDWTLTTSRRTPDDFLPLLLSRLQNRKINVIPIAQTPPGWVENKLAHAGQTWVTPDSVSMLYEALTSGCKVGIFDLKPTTGSRVANGINSRAAENMVATMRNIMKPHDPSALSTPFNEAERCARLIIANESK